MSKDTLAEMGSKLPGSPIVGKFNQETQDFEGHSRELEIKDGKINLIDITKPYGFVPTDAKVWFQYFLDDDAVTREYLCTEGYIWTKIYPESERIVTEGNNQSMELNEESVKGHWAKNNNSDSRFFIINEAIIEKLCILGENEEPCFEGSQIKTSFALKEGFEKLRTEMYSMMKQINNEGGTDQMTEEIKKNLADDDEVVVVEEEKEKEPTPVEPEPEQPVEQSVESESEGEDNTSDNESEPSEATTDYSAEIEALKASLEQAKSDYETLKAETDSLREFKLSIEKKEKEDMIAGFYMLNDEDKKDVVDNIDKYSLDEIEAKLSVICVRNKVNFSLDNETEEPKQEFTFNLNTAVENNDDEIPEWIKAVQETAHEMY